MSTPAERAAWKKAAEKRMAEVQKQKAEQNKRDELRMHLRGEQKAAEVKAEAKTKARRVWEHEGGDAATFETQWEGLYQDLIRQRTLNRMAGNDPFGIGNVLGSKDGIKL